MIPIWLAIASAGTANQVEAAAIADALAEELTRNQAELALPEAPRLYHLRYQLVTLSEVDVSADRGGLIRYNAGPSNGLGVEVRVGEAAWDNTGFGGWQNGFLQGPLPDELTAQAAKLGAWRLTDSAYKQAVEQHARKTAQVTPPPEHPGDYQLTGPVIGTAPIPDPVDGAPLRQLALDLSARLVRPGLPLERGEVHIGHEVGALWTLDSEGTRIGRPVVETTVRAVAQLRTEDGLLITDHHLWSEQLPDRLLDDTGSALAAMDLLAARLETAAAAPQFTDEYVGPVIFEKDAAIDLFRYLLVDQLEGTPAEVPFDSWFGDLGAGKDPVRVGRRVLPPGWSAFDDPGLAPDHPSTFAWDLEGTPARRVELVSDGIVRDVLMSRVPRKGATGTNGHARGWIGERAEGRVSQLVVEAPRSASAVRLRKKAAKLARAYGRDWFLVIERLQEPAVRQLGQDYGIWAESSETTLPPPLSVTRVWADGRTEVLRGARIVGAERWLLRDVIAAGPQREGTWLAPTRSFGAGITSGLPVLTRAPDVLVGEVEIVPAPGDPRDAPLLRPEQWKPAGVRATAAAE